jgi:hypothetical protein
MLRRSVSTRRDLGYLPGSSSIAMTSSRSTRRSRRPRAPRRVRGDHPRHHQGVAEHGPFLSAASRPPRCSRTRRSRAEGHAERPQGERDHRQADPAATGLKLPAHRDRAVGALPRAWTRSVCSTRTRSRLSSGSAAATRSAGRLGVQDPATLDETPPAGPTRLRRGRRSRRPRQRLIRCPRLTAG